MSDMGAMLSGRWHDSHFCWKIGATSLVNVGVFGASAAAAGSEAASRPPNASAIETRNITGSFQPLGNTRRREPAEWPAASIISVIIGRFAGWGVSRFVTASGILPDALGSCPFWPLFCSICAVARERRGAFDRDRPAPLHLLSTNPAPSRRRVPTLVTHDAADAAVPDGSTPGMTRAFS